MKVFDKLFGLARRVKIRLTRILLQEWGERTARRWIIVFQMGKVGSMNVVISLKKRMGITPVFHLHVLSEKQTSRMQDLVKQGAEMRRHRDLVEYADQVRHKLVRRDGPRKKIVSLVRDPIAQHIATTMSEYVDSNPGVLEAGTGFGPEGDPALHRFFLKRLEYEYDFIAPWFETEIRDLYGIDVFAVPFPVERGYAIYQSNIADLLIMRLEDLDRCHRQAIAEFLELPDFELLGANRAEDKGPDYSRAYSEFKNTVALPDELLDRLYSISWVRHFYSEKEIETFRSRWKNRK